MGLRFSSNRHPQPGRVLSLRVRHPQVHGAVVGVLIQLSHAVEAPLPVVKAFDVGQKRLWHQRAVRERLDVRNAHVQPLARVPVLHVDGREQADAVQVRANDRGVSLAAQAGAA